MINRRKTRIKSSLCGPYGLGYTRATMKFTISYKTFKISFLKNFVNILKIFLVRIVN